MSQIIFEASLNTEKLEAAIKRSNQTIGSWVKGVEDGSIKMDKAIEKTTKNTKEAVKEQQALIKSLEGDIKRIEGLLTSATPMAKNKGIIAELSQMKKSLADEQGKLNELQKTGIDQDAKEEVSKNKIIESLKKWGLGLLTITGAIKVFKAIVASSNVLTEEFGFAVDGAKGALQQFFQVFSTGAGQTGNPIANMIKGFKGAKELSQNIDLYNDSMRANQVLEAQEIETLKQKEAIFRNASNTAKQRETALNDWINIRKEAAARELKIEQDLNISLLNEIKNRPNLKGITDQEIGGFVTMYAKNPELMKKAEDLSKLYSGMAEWDTADKVAKLRKEIDALLPSGITFESLMSSIRLNSALSDKQIDALAESYKRLATTQGGGATVEAESARWLGSIINKGEAADKKLNDIKLQIDELTGSLATANESERKGIADKIILLEKELKLQQDIVNAALMAATIRESPLSKITGLKAPIFLPGGLKIPSTLSGKPTYDSGDYIPGTAMLTDQGKANQKKKSAEQDKVAEDSLKKQLELRNEIVNAAASLVNQIGQQIGLDEKSMMLLNAGLDAFTQLATGDLPGAAVALLSGIISQIPSAASRFEAQIENINQLLKEQERLIALSEEKGGQAQARENKLKTLDNNIAITRAEYERLQDQADIHLDLLGWRQKKADEAYQAWQDAIDAGEDATAAYDEYLTNTTASTIADSIMQGFQDGETSAADFADKFNGFMIQAINSALADALTTDLNPWYKQLAADMESGGELTEEERKNLKIWYDQIIADQKARRAVAYDVAGIDPNTTIGANTGLSGQIQRSITEQTGSELAGLFRRFADEQRVVKDYSVLGVTHLVGIEANTFGSWQELITANKNLEKAVTNLETISGNTGKNYSGPI